ncbi:MAG: acylglycerol kinase family protein, partial [Paludibacteraceae bacterium]|nr:acylglycerol kinase family protein [Paludibacteraceae bacterium]
MLGIIINPKSGKAAYRKQRLYLFRLLKQRRESFTYKVTKYAGHATELARELVERGYDRILVLGGDGTLSETIDGIMHARVPDDVRRNGAFGLMPRGT